MPERRPADLLEIRGLNVFYGRSHALQGVDLRLEHGVLSLVGRNGMGKTTLCNAIVGLIPAASGTIRFMGEELIGRTPAEIARMGLGYVPQGRRLWPSVTVDEHLRLASGNRGPWSISRIYETFPRLAERRSNRGNQLSGGEQQMLAISRALLLNPRLLIMDEPTKGLAPVIVEQVEEILVSLGEQAEIGVFVVEQNIGVATAVAEKVAIMINGQVNRIMEASRLEADRELQQRLLGVGQHGQAEAPEETIEAPDAAGTYASAEGSRSGPGLYVESEPANPLVTAGAGCADRNHRAHAHNGARADDIRRRPGRRAAAAPSRRRGAGDRRGNARHQRRRTALPSRPDRRCRRSRRSGRSVHIGGPSPADVPPHHIAAYYRGGPNAVFTGERGAAITAMAEAFEAWIKRQDRVGGLISAGGSGGSSLVAPAMRALPIGVPKVFISSVASGNVAPYVGPSDIMMLYSVTDVAGLNTVSRQVFANGPRQSSGWSRRAAQAPSRSERLAAREVKPAIG